MAADKYTKGENMSEKKEYKVPEKQVAQILKSSKGFSYLKADKDIKAGETFFVNNPREDAKKFAKNDEELQARLDKIPDFVLRTVVRGKN